VYGCWYDAIGAAASHSAFGRVGRPEDVADVVAFLASAQTRWVSGQIIDATGGSRLGGRPLRPSSFN